MKGDETSQYDKNETDSAQNNGSQNETLDEKDTNLNGVSNRNIVILNQDVTRGGVKVDTGRDSKTGFIISRLSLVNAKITDIGNYTCRLSSLPHTKQNAKGLHDTISVHVLQGENTKAIQRANSSPTQSFIDNAYILLAQAILCGITNITRQWQKF